MKTLVLWDWYDFGVCLKINKQNEVASYKFAIDFQIGWFNLWIQFWKKHISSKEWIEREMESKYGCDWFEQSLKALKDREVRQDLKKILTDISNKKKLKDETICTKNTENI